MELYKQFGGGAIVENSSHGLPRNVRFLREVSQRTGVHVIAGTGRNDADFNFYTYRTMNCLSLTSSVPFIDGYLLFCYVLLGLFFVQTKLIIYLLILHSIAITGTLCYNQFHSTRSYLSS
jgi:hypothetical protein